MKKVCSISVFIFVPFYVFSQVTIYEDLFVGSNGEATTTSTIASGTAPNNTAWSYVRMPGVSFHTHQFVNGYVKMDASTSSSNFDIGTSMLVKYKSSFGGSGTFNETGYNATLTNNTQILEWSFNFYSSKTPDGITNGGAVDLGGAFILGMEGNLIYSCGSPTNTPQNRGYAVVFGEATSNNYVKLVSFSGCYSPNNTSPCQPYGNLLFNRTANSPSYINTSCFLSDNSAIQSGWYSVKVQYNPTNDEWRLFVRHDGTSSPGDPQNLNSTHSKGANIDNTYTALWLGYIGLFGCFGPDNSTEAANDHIRWDNVRMKRDVPLIDVSTIGNCGGYTTICTPPTVTVNSSTICTGGSATVTATPSPAGTYTYSWTVPMGAANPGNVASFSTSVAGNYSVVVSSSATCSSNSSSGTMTVVADPSPPTATMSPSATPVCAGQTLTLTSPILGSGGTGTCNIEYRHSTNNGTNWSAWSTSVSSFSAVTGTNLIEIRTNCNGNGCDISSSTQYSWTVVADPALTNATVTNATICTYGSTDVSSTLSDGTGTQNPIWEYSSNGTSGWNPVSNGMPAGATYTNSGLSQMTISGITAVGTYYYRRNLSATGIGCNAVSSVVSVTVNQPPSIISISPP